MFRLHHHETRSAPIRNTRTQTRSHQILAALLVVASLAGAPSLAAAPAADDTSEPTLALSWSGLLDTLSDWYAAATGQSTLPTVPSPDPDSTEPQGSEPDDGSDTDGGPSMDPWG